MATDTIKGYKVSLMANGKGTYLHGNRNAKQKITHHPLSTEGIVNAN
jgi:hypothetical protein